MPVTHGFTTYEPQAEQACLSFPICEKAWDNNNTYCIGEHMVSTLSVCS